MAPPANRGSAETAFRDDIAAGRLTTCYCEGDEVALAMGAHDVLLMYPECGLDGLDALLAMSAGVAMVAFAGDRVAASMVLEGRNGFLVAPGHTARLAARLIELIERPDRRGLLSLGAFDAVRSRGFDLESVCDRYAELLNEMFAELRAGHHVRPRPLYLHPELGGLAPSPLLAGRSDVMH
jgi:glycosyltransferase involved in cell wall biosynthesis